jgi:ABC-type multidrug transport system fused ATPase/permease subunit
MYPDAYARARNLLNDHRGVVVTARVLGFLHSLLLLGLLLVLGLLAALIVSGGEARYPAARVRDLPRSAQWALNRATGRDQDDVLFDDSGLFPVVAGNLHSPNPLHRLGARGVLWATRLSTLRNNQGSLATLLAAGLGLVLVLSLIAQLRRSLIADVVCDVAATLRRQIHRQMYRLGQSSLPTEGTGPVVNLITREVNDIRDGLFADLMGYDRLPLLAAGLALSALALAPVLTVFLASLGVLVGMTAWVIRRDARLVADSAMRNAAVQLTLLHEDLGMLRTVRVYGTEAVDKQRFDEHLERFREADARRIKTEGLIDPTSWLVYGAGVALAVGLLAYSTVVSRQISAATALLLVAILAGLAYPVFAWQKMRRAIRQANRSAAAVFEFLERKPELHQQGGARFLPPIRDRITFEGVTLESRPGIDAGAGRVLLDGVSLEFPAGTRTAIMSLDEDAKHALVCLIPRLIDPKAGRVLIDGQDLREVTLESIRAQVATVLQADLVFTDSVTMNIGLGDPSYEMPRIIEAAKVAHAHNFIQDLPHGYDTVIGPLGHYLKPDEQYRVALARAYLHDPSIVILEEPNVALDDDTKHLIDDTVNRLAQGRTLIILPHRLSTIRSCQQIVVLHNGRVEVAGPPRQVQQDSKLFRHLQYMEFNQFATGEIEAGQMSA